MIPTDTYIASMILIILGSVVFGVSLGWKFGFNSGVIEGIARGGDIWREALGIDEEDLVDTPDSVLDAKEIQ